MEWSGIMTTTVSTSGMRRRWPRLMKYTIFTGGATHGQTVASSRVTLWDLHARYTPGKWDLSSVYSRGTISNTAAFNAPLVGSPPPAGSHIEGWPSRAAT